MQTAATVQIDSKQPHLQTSIFAVMSALSVSENAINLSQGFPDFQCHPKLIELFHRHLKKGHNQYAPMPGVAILRERIAEKTAYLYHAYYDPESEITVTCGATAALHTAITAIIHPGDEIIVFEPWYDAYIPMIEYNKGVAVPVAMKLPQFEIDWPKVRTAVSPRTKAIIINSPNNPAGVLLKDNDISQLKNLVQDTALIIISDEVYEHIIFDGQSHLSMSCYPELASRSFVISSFGKTFHATGWKVGYCLAPAAMMNEFRKMHQFVTFSVNTPAQYAYAEFMADKENYISVTNFYQKKRDLFAEALGGSRFRVNKCSGTYFQMADYSAISDEDDLIFARRLTKEFKIAAIPTSVFFKTKNDQKIIRFCFAKKDDTLKKAGDILCRI